MKLRFRRVRGKAAACCLLPFILVLVVDRAAGQLGKSVRLSGYVTDQSSGAPISGAYIDIQDDNYQDLTGSPTDSSGFYDISVPWVGAYTVSASVWADIDGYSQLRFVPASSTVSPGNAAALRLDFALRPGVNLVLDVYDNSGNLIRNGDLRTLTRGNVYATDLGDLPQYGTFFAAKDAYCLALANGGTWELSVPSLVVPVSSLNRVHLLFEVPGFGQVILDADNEGAGYSVAAQGHNVVLNFNYEAAKSELASLNRDYNAFRSNGYAISQAVADGIQSSTDHLRAAESQLAKTPPALPQAVAELNLSLNAALWAHEQLHLDKASADIETNRKGSVRLRVLDNRNQPIAGAQVSFRQTTHDFLFAANEMGKGGGYDPRYSALLRPAGIDYSYMIGGWGSVEPSPGEFNWSGIDTYQDIQAQLGQGFGLMGGLTLWLMRTGWAGTSFCPAYLDSMTFPQVLANAHDHMQALASRYRGRIDLWEINEQNMDWTNALNLTWDQKIEIYASAIGGMKEGNPDAKVIFTSNALPYEFNAAKLERTDVRAVNMDFPEFLRLLDARKTGADVIGLEFYYSGLNTDGYAPPGLNLVQISRLLDLYGALGKPVFFREFSAPSAQYANSSWWHRPWDQATQAEYLKAVYTIAFSKPSVEEIAWSYGVSDSEAYILSGGLLDANLNPKASYYALKALTESWTTSGQGQTDANGEFVLQGFAGAYDVSVAALGGAVRQTQIHVYERRNDQAAVSFDKGVLPGVSTAVSAASFLPGPIAPGEMVTIFGSAMASDTPAALTLNAAGLVDNELSGTRVLFDGQAAPLIYVSANQVSAVVPYALAGKPTTQLQIEYNGNQSTPAVLQVAGAAPGLFTADSSGKGQGAILNQDTSLNSPKTPATRGSIVVLYATGEGQTTPPGVDGKIAQSTLPKPNLSVSARIGGIDAEVLYAGAAPGLAAGVLQANLRIPMDVAVGDAVPIVLVVGGIASQPGVTLAVR